jgi:hypothetical protein
MRKKRARNIAFVIVVTLVAWVVIVGLPPTLLLSPGDRADYERLVNAKYFAGPAVGFLAVEPPEARALVSLAAHPGGGTAFKYLLVRGSPAGKIYGLVGLRRTNPAFFRVAVQVFRFWPGEVDTFFGCVIQTEPIRTVVATDQAGRRSVAARRNARGMVGAPAARSRGEPRRHWRWLHIHVL